MKILLAPNSFKECADSVNIAEFLKLNLSKEINWQFIVKPLSDGGDGFLSICESLFKAKFLTYLIKNSYNDFLNEFQILYSKEFETICIESASLIGLKTIPKSKKNPLLLNSEVLGKLLYLINDDVLSGKLSVKSVFIGIGGTATIDFGIGACSQLGLKILDKNGNKIDPLPKNFKDVKSYSFKDTGLQFSVKCIVDVETKLIGNPGAVEIYGKQKGAEEDDLKIIKSGIQNIINLIKKNNKSIMFENINGAGGGLAAGLNIFLNAELIKAKDFIVNYNFKDINLNEIDAVITGEGSLDNQTFEGKGVGVILDLFKNKNIPIFIICGSSNIPNDIQMPKNVFIIRLVEMFENLEQSIKNYKKGLEKACKLIINHLAK
jgi:glycerate kinase